MGHCTCKGPEMTEQGSVREEAEAASEGGIWSGGSRHTDCGRRQEQGRHETIATKAGQGHGWRLRHREQIPRLLEYPMWKGGKESLTLVQHFTVCHRFHAHILLPCLPGPQHSAQGLAPALRTF